jgi:hypothetical protein
VTDAERQAMIDHLEENLKAVDQPPVPGAPGAAFVSGAGNQLPDPFAGEPPRKPISKTLTQMGAGVAAEYAVEKALPLALDVSGGPLTVAAVLGSGLAQGAVTAGWDLLEGAKTKDAFNDAWGETGEGLKGAALGRFNGKLANLAANRLSNVRFIDADIPPQTKELMDDVHKDMRAYYEKTAGAKISGERRSWYNPYRYFLGKGETELDNTDTVENLRAAGLDPESARHIAIHGPATLADLSDRSLYRKLQQVTDRAITTSGARGRYVTTRNAMLNGVINDMGNAYGQVLDPEELGRAINEAARGRFNTLNVAKAAGMSKLTNMLPEDWTYNPQALRFEKLDLTNPADNIVATLSRKRNLTADEYSKVRTSISQLANDPESPYAGRAQMLGDKMDKTFMKQLPDDASRAHFDSWRDVDTMMNKTQLDQEFARGLWKNMKGKEIPFAEQLIKDRNIGNFQRIERALGKDSPEVMQLKRAVADRITDRAADVEGGVSQLHPDRMLAQLDDKGGIGAKYMDYTMGHNFSDRYRDYAKALTRFKEAGQSSGALSFTIGEAQAGAAYAGAKGLAAGSPGAIASVTAMLLAPGYVAKALSQPDTSSLITRLAGVAARGDSPKLMARIAGRLEAKIPFEELRKGPDPLDPETLANDPLAPARNYMPPQRQ